MAKLQGNPSQGVYSHSHAEMLPEPGIQLPAIRSMIPFLPRCGQGPLKASPDFQYVSNAESAPSSGQDPENAPVETKSKDSTRVASSPIKEPAFARLLTAGCDMKTVLEAIDQELSPKEVLDVLRVDLIRPPMPEEPVSDPDYKPRSSTITGKPPADVQHSKKETERRAQHKYYLDLSEIKIPDFFLKLCGWDEPRDSGGRRTPRTKSSILQAGCLYMWFLSGPVLRCFKSLLHDNHRLKEEVQQLANENHGLRLQCESLQSEAQIRAKHMNAAGSVTGLNPPSLTLAGSHCYPSSSSPNLSGFIDTKEPSFSVTPHKQLSPECPARVHFKSGKGRSLSISSHNGASPASPPKKRKTNRYFIDKQDTAVRLNFDEDTENSLPDIDSVGDQNNDDLTQTQMYRLRLSLAPSPQSATPSHWNSPSITSTSSSWDQPSPHSIAGS